MIETALRYKQIVEMLGVAGYYHSFKLIGNIIDGEEGVIEHRVSQLYARHVLRWLRMEVVVSGAEKVPLRRRYCVVSSHSSYLDWAVLLGYFPSPLRFIAKRELIWMPVVGSYLKLRGVLIDRKRGVDAGAAIRTAARDELPWPILIFPEGTRSADGRVKAFRRRGLSILAEEGLLMVPVTIRGSFDAFPRQAKYIKTGHRLELIIGAPIDPAEFGVEGAIDEVERRVREAAASG